MAVLCCDGLPVLRMSSAVSWRKDYNQPEYMCIRKEFFRKVSEGGCPVFLMIRRVKVFLFLVGNRGAALPEVCLRLKADWSESG